MYFPKQYLKDLETYKKAAQSECVCGRVIDDLIKNTNVDFINLKLFFIYTFYLNLYHEVISLKFSKLLEVWEEYLPGHIDYKCTYNQNIISWHRFLKNKRYQDQSLIITGKDYLNVGRDFLSYLETIPGLSDYLPKIHDHIVRNENPAIKELINQLTKQQHGRV